MELCLKTGIHLSRIHTYEQGVNSVLNISYDSLEKYAKCLGMEPAQLIKHVKENTKGELNESIDNVT